MSFTDILRKLTTSADELYPIISWKLNFTSGQKQSHSMKYSVKVTQTFLTVSCNYPVIEKRKGEHCNQSIFESKFDYKPVLVFNSSVRWHGNETPTYIHSDTAYNVLFSSQTASSEKHLFSTSNSVNSFV